MSAGAGKVNLRDLQSWIFFAGANGMMTGDYLTDFRARHPAGP